MFVTDPTSGDRAMHHIYARVSSKSQDVASQVPDLKRWERASGGEAKWHKDKFTGKTMDRPAFRAMMEALRPGDTIVVWRLDRLGRSARGLSTLFDDLKRIKVNLISLRENIDLSSPSGRLMCHILSSVSEYETEVRRERVLAGQAVARERGVHLGRPKGIRTPLKVTEDARRIAREMRARGRPVTEIARTLGLSRQHVYNLLADQTA
jgi:DNA invertase Pin-like site-specific DNA recombinase